MMKVRKPEGRINLYASPDFVAMVDEAASRLGISKAALCRIAVSLFLEQVGLRATAKKEQKEPHGEVVREVKEDAA